MPRVPELDAEHATASIREVMRKQEDAFGFVLNPTKVMGYLPEVTRAQARLGQALDESGHLEASLRYLVYAKVASLNGCPF